MIPQMDPGAGYRAQANEINEAVHRVLGSGQYCMGREGFGFEAEFNEYLGSGRAVGCANGTDAISLALRALGLGPGCTVVTVSHTAVATVAAIELVGATPLLIDIDPDHFTMDPDELASVLSMPPPELPPISAVVAVHLYGQSADLSPILMHCSQHRIPVIEDCAQAHGATYLGRRVGVFGEAAAFSFYPTKNLGALGDAGLVTLRDVEVEKRVRALRQYGWRERFISEEPGVNSRLDEVQAAVLRVKLRNLDANNLRRQEIAHAYDRVLASHDVRPPARRQGCEHVFHQYILNVKKREELRVQLRSLGVATAVHYPVPVHEQPAYAGRIRLGPSRCRISTQTAQEVVSLPMYPEMTDGQVEQVCLAVQQSLAEGAYGVDRRPTC
jgi:dTDP-4-amino-4,6-dideoxygalactose transaminase